MVIWALSLTALASFVGMAIDLGNIAGTKQHTESAAANAALAAVIDLAPLYPASSGSKAGPGIAAVQEALAVSDAETYLTANYSSLAGANFASGCAGALPSSVYRWPSSNCFGFFNPEDPSLNQTNPTAIAVAVPTQQVHYTFGRAGGLTTQAVSGLAYASLKSEDSGYALPMSYSAGGPTGLECLKTGSGNKAGICTGFATGSGDFGVINSPRYTIFPGSATSGGNNSVIETDADIGIDHLLNSFQLGDAAICDATSIINPCTADNAVAPYDTANYANVQTGQTITILAPPLMTGHLVTPDGSCTLGPRFNHPDGFVATSSCAWDNPTVGPTSPRLSASNGDTFGSSYPLNGVQVSAYLNANGRSLTSSCAGMLPAGDTASNTAVDAGGTGSGNVWTNYDSCVSAILEAGVSTPIFSANIEQSPRFGVIPLIDSATGTAPVEITGFLGTYIDLVSGSNNKVDAIRAWLFPLSAIDLSAGSGGGLTNYAGGPYVVNLCSFAAGNC
jgi:hypothetical protein